MILIYGSLLTFFEELEQVWERFETTHFLKQLWSAWYPNESKTQASFQTMT